ncbi:Qat anti-phage system QueC-like protein QatC [Kaistia terrae]|uniref:Qat anti-phage system QueC-like protein QatC n=1 Tax=Kaistia terrae TaxID=537017 RepID=A0ABW0Q1W6_9HYPH|nr:Qat anti-phage system QueC-like protein QatC [Kaistia terrae]MCX5578982.1 7-cyano-7-deazaguanine synthase [Kaistia terrae]
MTNIVCIPPDLPDVPGMDIRFDIYSNSRIPGRGRVGDLVPRRLRKLGLSPSGQAWDFTSFTMAAVAADEAVSRERSPDGWTRQIDLTVAVAAPDFWNTQRTRLTQALRFLSGDIWDVRFVGGGGTSAPRGPTRRLPEDMVCLLSGGMDSLIGAIDAVGEGLTPLLVSQMAKGDTKDQKRFACSISPRSLHLQLNHHARPPHASERSQRARSIAFLGFGVMAATCLQQYADGAVVELRVPENGFISQNVPLTPLRTGSLSTRTTHPFFLRLIQETLDAAALRVRINNPYEHMTKGEMLRGCTDLNLLQKLVDDSTSCGRYSRTGFQHCGRCVPCQVRRGAYLAWGQPDTTSGGYKYTPLGQNDARHAGFDDVRSVAIAVETVRRHGIDELVGGAMNRQLLGDLAPYRQVVQNGIAELAALHTSLRVP